MLAAAGAELIPFSPLSDKTLPDADLLYFGGGFPECFETQLSENKAFCRAIRDWNLPIYAECGGLYYLSLIGKIPGKMQMRDRLQHFGYTEAIAQTDTCLVRKGEKIKGHMFHYSHWEGPPNLYTFEKRGRSITEGYAAGKIHASFLHVHFASKPGLARRLLEMAQKDKEA